MCRHTGCTEREAADFISAVVDEVTTRLKARQNDIEVPGLGTFGVDHQGYVVFTPNQEISAEVNEPFSLFESVMLEPGITAEELAGADTTEESAEPVEAAEPEATTEVETKDIEPAAPVTEEKATTLPAPEPKVTETAKEITPEPIEPVATATAPAPVKETAPVVETVPDKIEETPKPVAPFTEKPAVAEALATNQAQHTEYHPQPAYHEEPEAERRGFNPVIAYILGIVTGFLVCCLLVYLIYPKLMDSSIDSAYGVTNEEYADDDEYDDSSAFLSEEAVEETPSFTAETRTADTIEQPAAEPAKPTPPAEPQQSKLPATEQARTQDGGVVYDTVRPGYFLTKIAQKHYGVQEFWVYIYEENKDRISNPMKLPAGFKVVIPPAEKYGINPNDPTSVEKAKNLSHELNRKFK